MILSLHFLKTQYFFPEKKLAVLVENQVAISTCEEFSNLDAKLLSFINARFQFRVLQSAAPRNDVTFGPHFQVDLKKWRLV